MFTADDIRASQSTALINNRWVLARPLPYQGYYGLIMRIKDAWQVLIGKADAVRWIGQ